MKKQTKIIIWIISIMAVIIIVPDISMYYQRIKLKFYKLPEPYKSYPYLDNLKDDYYEIIKIQNIGHNPILQLNDSIVLFTYGREKKVKYEDFEATIKTDVWNKLKLNGQVIDSIKYDCNTSIDDHLYLTFQKYIVDVKGNTYNTWIMNGDTVNRAIKKFEQNKIFNMADTKKMIAGKAFISLKPINPKNKGDKYKQELIVYKNHEFISFYTDSTWYQSGDDWLTNEGEVKYNIERGEISNQSSILKRAFVHKEEWSENPYWDVTKWSYGSGNGSSGDSWSGTTYLNLKMPKKSLHFKEPVSISYPEGSLNERFMYSVYKPKNGEYVLLNDKENDRYYLIRPKIN